MNYTVQLWEDLPTYDEGTAPETVTPYFSKGVTGQILGPSTDVSGVPEHHQTGARLHPPSPNPSKKDVAIGFELSENGRVWIDVFDIAGRKVKSLLNEAKAAGYYVTKWDGMNSNEQRVSPGIFFVCYHVNGTLVNSRRIVIW